ncbi:MAG TPA: YicC/YloC family endoribonuclease [Candidatus Nitrosocosmicus sp.]|nr:YicC/YloC family endoribonuclease [Candidatus Nitrosocosmicus sp.]
MTGYGRAEVSGPRISAAVECRSVNHRHLDISLKLPRALAVYEPDARRLIQAAVQRGRVDVSATLTPAGGGSGTTLSVNAAQAREYATAARAVADELRLTATLRVEWLLAQPGVLTRDTEPAVAPEEGWALVAQALEAALADLVARREAEGKALAQELGALHETLEAQMALVAARVPVAQTRRMTRLRERIQALLGEIPVDEGRLATEVAALAERADITEELARLRVHLGDLRARIDEGGQVGRPLDFLIQEINREVNTVGSKADDLEISQAVIAAKATLEKIREQVQNIE